VVRRLQHLQGMRFRIRPRETPEEARQRRLCRFMLGLPPEIVYHHVREGVTAIAALGVVLVAVVAWQLGQFAMVAPALLSGMLLAVLTPTVLVIRARYRHVVAGALVLAMLLGLLAAAVHRYGYPATVAFVVGPTPSAIADAVTPR
jgi:uncharacterized membrane protein